LLGTDKKPPTRKEFTQNIDAKMEDPGFRGDMEALLRTEIEYDQQTAYEWLLENIIVKM